MACEMYFAQIAATFRDTISAPGRSRESRSPTYRQDSLGGFARRTNRLRAHPDRRDCSTGDSTNLQKNAVKQYSPRDLLQASSKRATRPLFWCVNIRGRNINIGTICDVYVDGYISGCIGNKVSAQAQCIRPNRPDRRQASHPGRRKSMVVGAIGVKG